MQMRKSKWLSMFLVFAMVLGFMAPLNVQTAYAGTEVTYLGGHLGDQKVQEGESTYQAFCANKGRPMGTVGLASTRIKYAWDEAPTEYQAIGANSIFGDLSGFSYALSLVILPGLYDGDSPRSDTQNSFMPNDENDVKTCAQYLKNVFYYAELDGHSADEIQDAIYDIIYQGKNNPNTGALGTLAQKAINGSDNGKTELWVYLPHPDEFTMGKGYNRGGVDQALVRGIPHISPEVKVYLHGVKELKGGQLQDEQFSFTISGPNIEETTKVNYGSDIWFPEITFDKEGEYTYTIKEVKGNDATITYDEKEKTFTVVVTKDESGKLIASVDGKQIATSDDKKDGGSLKAGEIDGSVDKYKFVNEVKTDEPKEPTVKTKVSPNEVEAAPDQTFVDTVTLTNLVEGVEYTITGALMDKEAQEKVEATCEPVVFTASAEDAAAESVEKKMEFTFDGTNFEGKELVVFETLSWKEGDETKEVPHTDYDDADQTITVKPQEEKPTVKTKANPSEIEAAADQTITDTITLENLTVGTEYTVTGKLMDADGNEVEATCEPITFTAENAKEEHEMVFTLDATEYAGKKLVVFETLTWADGEVKHEDLKDEDQTVSVKKPEEPEKPKEYTVKISKNALGGAEVPGAKMVLTDSEGTEVANWESTDKAHEVQLKAGKYVLEEKVAPDGYKQVTTKIEFEVTEDGTVNLITTTVDAGGKISVKEGDHIVLEDALKDDKEPTDEDGSTTPGGDDKEGEQEPGGEAPDPNKDNKDTTPKKDDSSKPSNDTPSKKPNNTPKTGDESNAAMWIAILGLAGAALAGTKLVSKKK